MKHQVIVYGTLKRGHDNHHLLARARFLGEDRLTGLTLYNLGPYPGARLEPSSGVSVEAYAVDDRTLRALDELEDCFPDRPEQSLYLRQRVATRFGPCWVYLYNRPVRASQRIDSGTW
ncbi:gamma-glutamylcyclotransferase [Marinobacter lutaoensis]|uniref:Gamma-glutamylcyclotransferase family protein n=1 Tax=Marinobacter lutaoensis TaxID=135739 RepID=A0A1V2DQI5_9GAMM|nr:gamma-glutamylcyclotransferase family protein [Marinobacter lutaoensis]ONF42907.1 gamma-glutamylcyclotransferase [Marinobacter lutaoensis]